MKSRQQSISVARLHAAGEHTGQGRDWMEQAIAESVRTRRRHDSLLSLIVEGVLETDASGAILDVSPAAAELLKYGVDELAGRPLGDFLAPPDRPLLAERLEVLQGDDAVHAWPMRFRPRVGLSVSSEVRARRLEPAADEPAAILWTLSGAGPASDATQALGARRGQPLSRQLRERTTRLEELDRNIGDRLAGIRRLARRIVELQDFEGQKLARELRERFGQALGAVKLNLDNLGRAVPQVSRAPVHREAVRLVDVALQRLRQIYFELSPPLMHGLGLAGQIRQLLARFPATERTATTLEADPLPLLSPQVESATVWVAREALNNVVRHARATLVEVALRREGNRLFLRIRDNGRGFDVPATRRLAEKAGCFGLVGMEERVALLGGDLEIMSAPAQGTEIRAVFPGAAR